MGGLRVGHGDAQHEPVAHGRARRIAPARPRPAQLQRPPRPQAEERPRPVAVVPGHHPAQAEQRFVEAQAGGVVGHDEHGAEFEGVEHG